VNPNQADTDQDGIGDACEATSPAGQAVPPSSNQSGGSPSPTPPTGQTTPSESLPPRCGFGAVQMMWVGLLGLGGLRLVNRRRRP